MANAFVINFVICMVRFDFLCFYAVTLSYFWVVVVIVADNAVYSLAFGNVAVAKLLL